MRKKITLTILMLVIGTIVVAGCSGSTVDIKGIDKVEISFSGEGEEAYSCILTEKENLKEAMKIFKDLETYKSQHPDSGAQKFGVLQDFRQAAAG